MKKSTKIIIAILVITALVIIAGIVVFTNLKSKSKLAPITSSEDVASLIEGIYTGIGEEAPYASLFTTDLDLSDENTVKYFTGISNTKNVEYVSISQPMMNVQPYSLIIAKVKEGSNAEEVAKEISENINPRRWICVTAPETFVTSSGNVVMCVMGENEFSQKVYNEFKKQAGKIGEEYHKVNVSEEDMIDDADWPAEIIIPDDGSFTDEPQTVVVVP